MDLLAYTHIISSVSVYSSFIDLHISEDTYRNNSMDIVTILKEFINNKKTVDISNNSYCNWHVV